ncbi:unnamed protein product [Paramecium sonneborni]|uniref:Uncharacterized protein n=1 Tax=Paramecium sonneborni TaxID=65129 RepID=A0A8S1ML74_9CILI|nr:unnamed protein product [Paramecium sonneborni]
MHEQDKSQKDHTRIHDQNIFWIYIFHIRCITKFIKNNQKQKCLFSHQNRDISAYSIVIKLNVLITILQKNDYKCPIKKCQEPPLKSKFSLALSSNHLTSHFAIIIEKTQTTSSNPAIPILQKRKILLLNFFPI